MYILNLEYLGFFVEKLQGFEVDNLIEKLMIKFMHANLWLKLWSNLYNVFLAQVYSKLRQNTPLV